MLSSVAHFDQDRLRSTLQVLAKLSECREEPLFRSMATQIAKKALQGISWPSTKTAPQVQLFLLRELTLGDFVELAHVSFKVMSAGICVGCKKAHH